MKIAVLGCGTVGSGVVDIIDSSGGGLRGFAGEDISVKHILDLKNFPQEPYGRRLVRDISEILDDAETETVVEAMGGIEPAFTFCRQCLEHGKNVVTSNKALVAEKATELFAAARENGVSFMFEAAVCGGIPLIRTLFALRASNEILSFSGIFNGTTNYILTQMIENGMSFADALKAAQEKGYAEKDPTDDIQGLDACRKTCILASIASGCHIYPDEIHTEGITGITLDDALLAKSAGFEIKLLGRYEKMQNGSFSAITAPFLVPRSLPLAGVSGVYNACSVRGSNAGTLMFYGRGAGKKATASAVAGDIAEGARIKGCEPFYSWGAHKNGAVQAVSEYRTSLYIRAGAACKTAAVTEIKSLFGKVRFLSRENAPENELAFITPEDKEGRLRETLEKIGSINAKTVIRVI